MRAFQPTLLYLLVEMSWWSYGLIGLQDVHFASEYAVQLGSILETAKLAVGMLGHSSAASASLAYKLSLLF